MEKQKLTLKPLIRKLYLEEITVYVIEELEELMDQEEIYFEPEIIGNDDIIEDFTAFFSPYIQKVDLDSTEEDFNKTIESIQNQHKVLRYLKERGHEYEEETEDGDIQCYVMVEAIHINILKE